MNKATTARAISHIGVVSVRVKDQDEALSFYTERLGFEKRTDASMGEGMRWLTVAPAGSSTEVVLSTQDAGSPVGSFTGVILETEDIDAAYRELSGRGVRFTTTPTMHPWGGWAEFVDQDNNGFGLHSGPRGE
jgi:predicted enzyme related to lactoylglutathione lyase